LNNLAVLRIEGGALQEGQALLARAAQLDGASAPTPPDLARTLDNQAAVLAAQGHAVEAEAIRVRALELRRRAEAP
jgi:hypothetical protein